MITRRSFLTSTDTATGGMLIGFQIPLFANVTPFQTEQLPGSELNAWLIIDSDNTLLRGIQAIGNGRSGGLIEQP